MPILSLASSEYTKTIRAVVFQGKSSLEKPSYGVLRFPTPSLDSSGRESPNTDFTGTDQNCSSSWVAATQANGLTIVAVQATPGSIVDSVC